MNKDGSKRVYLQIAKSVWENGKPHQRVICTLGRLEYLKKGGIDTLIRGLDKFTGKLKVIEISKDLLAKDDKEYGAPLVFQRLFKLLGLEDILESSLVPYNHTFNVKAAIFAMVLNRIISPSSKLRVYQWLDDVYHPSFKTLKLQHLYRPLDFLDEYKEKIEEDLFEKVREPIQLKARCCLL